MPIISESESENDSECDSGGEVYCDDGRSYAASSAGQQRMQMAAQGRDMPHVAATGRTRLHEAAQGHTQGDALWIHSH